MSNQNMYDIINEYIDKAEVEDRQRSATFLIWFLMKMFHLDKDTAVSCVCDEKNDKGIDAIYIDPIEEEIHIFQSKLKTKYPSTIGDKILRDFEGVRSWFESNESVTNLLSSTINPELKSLIEENKLFDLVSDYKVRYNFIINSERDHNTNEYLRVNGSIELWCLDRIKQSYHEIKFDPFVQDTFTFTEMAGNEILEFKNNDQDMVMLPLLASDIVRLKGIDDLTLFHSNVRFGLGNTRVNKSIVKTLKDESEKDKFIMFHNGISIVCSEYEFIKGSLTIKNYSIVNGAQSTLTFHKNRELLDDDIKVMAKIIKTGDNQRLSELITYYSNNQNSISMRDLRSNDTIQKRLSTQFEDLDSLYETKVIYVPKRGAPIGEGYKDITSDYAAQLITACYLKRPYDTHLKSSMFDSKYNDIFSKNITANKIFLFYHLHNLLKKSLPKVLNQKVASYGLAQFAILNVMLNVLESDKETKHLLEDPSTYFKKPQEYDAFFIKLYDLIIRVFNHVVSTLEKDSEFIYKNYFKNKANVELLVADVITHFETSLSISETSFSGFYEAAMKSPEE